MITGQINTEDLEHLKIEFFKDEYIVTLVDTNDCEILKGYGQTIEMALNDLHSNLM